MKRSRAGAGHAIEDEVEECEPCHFLLSWIREELKTWPDNLRIMHVKGDSMEPTLMDGDVVLVNTSRCHPSPPGIFVLFDGVGVMAKRVERIPNGQQLAARTLE